MVGTYVNVMIYIFLNYSTMFEQ